MLELENRQILVIGLGRRGQAACEFLRRSGAKVVGVDNANNHNLRRGADRLRPLGVEDVLGVSVPPERDFSLAVLSCALPMNTPLVDAVLRSKVPLISEPELGLQQSKRLTIAIAGTNGKGTTAELVERGLVNNHSYGRGQPENACRLESFYSLHRREFIARNCGRSGEECDFRRRSFAFTGLFELGSVSKPSTSR